MAAKNSRMKYLHVSLSGLRGRHHPALANIVTTTQVQKSRIHLKMLAGDYFTYEVKSRQSGGSPHCRCCSTTPSSSESLVHILARCGAYSEIKERIAGEFKNACFISKSKIDFDKIYNDDELFCQFVLDPASFNLKARIHMNDPILDQMFRISRDYCFAVNATRMKMLKTESNKGVGV